ncbi:MAG: SLC13/DASS family transporter [Lysinibacillus sp.]|nr:SLC13/DASS family transporter [Lysinibacillus sp.]
MISSTWNKLWDMHDQVKEMFRYIVKPDVSKLAKVNKNDSAKEKNNKQNDGGGSGRRSYTTAQLIGLILGPLLFVFILLFFNPSDLSPEAKGVLASTAWIATWWITEAIPIPAASLLPLILFPLTGSSTMKTTAAAYGDETIFLFMGGFIIALAMEKWNLHKRIALSIISAVGTNMDRIVLGFMIATGFLSMWISNTATAMMMIPIGLAIIKQVTDALKDDPKVSTAPQNLNFGKSLMLGIAYAASLGGVGTLIGTPPNTILAGAVDKMFGIKISFAEWMLFGVPFAWIFIFFTWFYLVKFAYPSEIKTLPGGRAVIDNEKKVLGKASTEDKWVLVILTLAALSWITRTFILEKINENITDGMIAVIFAIILFIIPSANRKGDRLMDWKTAVQLPWGILLLFGGGLAIAAGFVSTGLSEWIGTQLMGLQGLNLLLLIFLVCALVLALTEITSNTATASMMFPIMASFAIALGVHPYTLMIAAGVSASCAFMLPVATPPNAAVFGSGYLKITDMMRAGFALNVFAVLLITLLIYFWLPFVWGIDLYSVPEIFKQ